MLLVSKGSLGVAPNPSHAPMAVHPASPERNRLIPSPPLTPHCTWQTWNQDFTLFDQVDEMAFPQPGLGRPDISNGFSAFSWPNAAIPGANYPLDHPSKPSLEGISPLSEVPANGAILNEDKNGTSKVRDLEDITETHELASTKVSTERDCSGFELRRRAKNRVAASKSRAKSKRHHDALQERYDQSLERNGVLKRQEQSLRATAAFLKDCLLQHNSSSCGCKRLHEFNTLRAEKIARGMVSPGSMLT